MRLGSLFAGIGGFDLAARWMGWETAWFSEIDPYASAVLAKHWPGVPNHGDITRIDFTTVEPVDMLCGGFPCQPVSVAGKRKAQDDERWLWPEFARCICGLRPRWVVAENVPGLLSRGFGDVLGDLAAFGYDAEWTLLSAAGVGAPHLRERVWLVAYPGPAGCPDVQGGAAHGFLDWSGGLGRDCGARGGHQGWGAEPPVGRVVHGLPRRVDRVRGLGNAVVPQCAFQIFRAIEARDVAMMAVA